MYNPIEINLKPFAISDGCEFLDFFSANHEVLPSCATDAERGLSFADIFDQLEGKGFNAKKNAQNSEDMMNFVMPMVDLSFIVPAQFNNAESTETESLVRIDYPFEDSSSSIPSAFAEFPPIVTGEELIDFQDVRDSFIIDEPISFSVGHVNGFIEDPPSLGFLDIGFEVSSSEAEHQTHVSSLISSFNGHDKQFTAVSATFDKVAVAKDAFFSDKTLEQIAMSEPTNSSAADVFHPYEFMAVQSLAELPQGSNDYGRELEQQADHGDSRNISNSEDHADFSEFMDGVKVFTAGVEKGEYHIKVKGVGDIQLILDPSVPGEASILASNPGVIDFFLKQYRSFEEGFKEIGFKKVNLLLKGGGNHQGSMLQQIDFMLTLPSGRVSVVV